LPTSLDIDQLRLFRLARKLRQADMADSVGISRTEYNRIERGMRDPDSTKISKMAATLGVPVQMLFLPIPYTTPPNGEGAPLDPPSSGSETIQHARAMRDKVHASQAIYLQKVVMPEQTQPAYVQRANGHSVRPGAPGTVIAMLTRDGKL
jgi:transcriptional regulator with XRE-family HTH domain